MPAKRGQKAGKNVCSFCHAWVEQRWRRFEGKQQQLIASCLWGTCDVWENEVGQACALACINCLPGGMLAAQWASREMQIARSSCWVLTPLLLAPLLAPAASSSRSSCGVNCNTVRPSDSGFFHKSFGNGVPARSIASHQLQVQEGAVMVSVVVS